MQNDDPQSGAAAPKGLKSAGWFVGIAAIAIVAGGIVSRMGDAARAQSWSSARSIPTVHLVSVKSGGASDGLTLPGTMQAWNAAKLYARVGGYLKSWDRDIGAQVGAGTPLGQIDTPELDQQIVQARADLVRAKADEALAQSTAARWSDLLTSNSVSRQEADEKNGDWHVKQAAVQASQANLGRLLALKGFATLRAPFAGTVTLRSADVGDLVGPGSSPQQPIFAIADIHRIRVYVNAPQSYSAAMKPGLGAVLTVPDYPGRKFAAQIVGTSGAIDPQTGAFQVQLVVDNHDGALKPGGYGQLRFDASGQAGSVQIPSSALIFRARGTQVALVDRYGHAHLRSVTVGRDLGQMVEVVAGLSATDRIVDNPPDSLGDGELVRVQGNVHA